MKFTAEQHYAVARRLNERAARETDPARKAVLAKRANRFLALVRLAGQRARMLTPAEIAELRLKAKVTQDYARQAFKSEVARTLFGGLFHL